ncbi:helix-turn-helix transcriptional regulator [Pantoea agglomerans]|uniref:helix-turn-helix transcriptional regulator n=1 Tax=Enterobacter agglomerans TaxID=549 RepID=UPI003C799115
MGKINAIAIIAGCQYASLGLKAILKSFFQSQIDAYHSLHEIQDHNNEMLVIAVLNERNINYSDILWMQRRTNANANMLVLCDGILQKILFSVFNIDCLYIPYSAPINEIRDAIIKLILEEGTGGRRRSNSKLTSNESRILMMLAAGMSIKQVSEIRKSNIKTISSHKAKLFRKIGMPNTPKAVSLISLYIKSISISVKK